MKPLFRVNSMADDLMREALCSTNAAAPMAAEPPTAAQVMADIQTLWRSMKAQFGELAPPRYDVYPNPFITEAYELRKPAPMLEGLPIFAGGRRVMVVPKDSLDVVVRALVESGADVRVAPVYCPPSQPRGEEA